MATELICSVCEQRIERCPVLKSQWMHGVLEDHKKAKELGCWGKAVPKALEPKGEKMTNTEKEYGVAKHIATAASDGCTCAPCEAARSAFEPTGDDKAVPCWRIIKDMKNEGLLPNVAGDTAMGFTCPKHGTKYGYCEECLFPKAPEPALCNCPRCAPKAPGDDNPVNGFYCGDIAVGCKGTCTTQCNSCNQLQELYGFANNQATEPKAPDVIEVELPPSDVTTADLNIGNSAADTAIEFASHKQVHAYIKNAVAELESRERQLKAEIAAKREAYKQAHGYSLAFMKAEKERDAALEEVKSWMLRLKEEQRQTQLVIAERKKVWDEKCQLQCDLSIVRDGAAKHVADLQEANTQLQRDLDAAKELLDETKHYVSSPVSSSALREKIDNLLK